MSKRSVKISSEMRKTDDGSIVYPFIRLRGRWIADAGFDVGTQMAITVKYNKIIIEKEAK